MKLAMLFSIRHLSLFIFMFDLISGLTLGARYEAYNSLTSFQDVVPQVLCKKAQKSVNSGYLVLSWSPLNISDSYIVESRHSSSDWKYLILAKDNFMEIMNLQVDSLHQFRVMPLLSNTGFGSPFTSNWFKFESVPSVLSAPSDLQVSDFSIENGHIKAVVRWNASKELPCMYEIVWLASLESDSAPSSQIFSLPHADLSTTISGLSFNTNYTVRVTPLQEGMTRKGESIDAWFLTPTCLKMNNNDFNTCGNTSLYLSGFSWTFAILLVVAICILCTMSCYCKINNKSYILEGKFAAPASTTAAASPAGGYSI